MSESYAVKVEWKKDKDGDIAELSIVDLKKDNVFDMKWLREFVGGPVEFNRQVLGGVMFLCDAEFSLKKTYPSRIISIDQEKRKGVGGNLIVCSPETDASGEIKGSIFLQANNTRGLLFSLCQDRVRAVMTEFPKSEASEPESEDYDVDCEASDPDTEHASIRVVQMHPGGKYMCRVNHSTLNQQTRAGFKTKPDAEIAGKNAAYQYSLSPGEAVFSFSYSGEEIPWKSDEHSRATLTKWINSK